MGWREKEEGEENKHYSEKWLPDDPDFSESNAS